VTADQARAGAPPSVDRSGDVVASELFHLSNGNVVATPPSGPVLRRTFARRRARPEMFVPVLRRGSRVLVAVLTLGWALSMVTFWVWWLTPQHRVGWPGLVVNSLLLLYLSVIPINFLLAANRLRAVNPALGVPAVRVAFVVTKAPSEPWPVARNTLVAMISQAYPHDYDVWLADEDPTPEVLDWCARRRIRVSTRRGEPGYHRTEWPRRTKCKEGNLAWFYDNHGYDGYDVVVQLDCDHVPEPGYLREMVRPFADPAVGYVAAPSVCDANADQSWAGRSRLYREATFHGPFQAGHNDGLAPLCIGSHYAVRTAALRDIGGLGPELAEDFSTSFLLTSAGWEGAFAPHAQASGDGPLTFGAMVTQEFQWSRSLVTVSLDLVPGHLRRLPWKQRLRFVHALSYYPLLAVTTVVGLSLPPIAAVTGLAWVNVNYVEFLLRWAAASIWLLLLVAVLRRNKLLRPVKSPLLSWELWLGSVTRWPFVAWGVFAATMQKIRPRPVGFKVTPKTRDGLEPLPVALVLPYLAVVTVMTGAALIGEHTTRGGGYLFLCLLAACSYAIVALAVCLLHAGEIARSAGARFGAAVRATVALPLVLSLATLPPLTLAIAHFPPFPIWSLGR
jgi:cellulose synthase/poly-beta-1,6-N-acetylglucosamine synthase-like glycosyltransferase